MKIVRVVAVLAAVALSVVMFPNLQALPYFGLVLPPTPPTPPAPPAPPAAPAMSSIDVVPEPPEPPEPPAPPEPVEMASMDLEVPEPPAAWHERDGDAKYVLSFGDMNVVNGDGDTNFEHLRHAYGRNFFWFRHDGTSYVVRDAAVLRELVELYRPQSDLGREQGALGRKQGALGRQQGELGRRQGELGREQARIGVEQLRMSRRYDDDDPSLAVHRGELERKERDLSRRQDDLGREQSELSREIEHKLQPMIREMIRKGIAERAR